MVKIKEIAKKELDEIIAKSGFDPDLLTKDYYITLLLSLLKDIRGIYFKGGTALQKTLLDYSRLSEDIDFTLTEPIVNIKENIIKQINNSHIFNKITKDKDTKVFLRLVVHYKTSFGKDKIFIDLNKKAKLLLKPENKQINHLYPNIPKFKIKCLNKKEMIAEKVAASIARNKPRDHYDIYQIIKHKLPIDMKLVKIKCKHSNHDLNIIKMFNKAKKLHNSWDKDMIPLLRQETSFKKVMKTLAKHFKLKQEKAKK